MSYYHLPVLLNEVIAGLSPKRGESFVDCTIGGGGHAAAILQRTAPVGRLLGLDRDGQAITAARGNLAPFKERVTLINDSYLYLTEHALSHGFTKLAGILFDLGFSSPQLSDPTRGFSFQIKAPLDLRYNTAAGTPAWQMLTQWSVKELTEILRDYGEVPQAGRLARAIINEQRLVPLTTTTDLLAIVDRVQGKGRRSLPTATLVWQALRIAVNNELKQLQETLPQTLPLLAPGGRLAIISFHSGEDRVVKNWLRQESTDCLCPPSSPICRCGHKASLKLINQRPITPAAAEIKTNPRARSAKLRLAVKLPN